MAISGSLVGRAKERFLAGAIPSVPVYSHWTSHAAHVNKTLQWLETRCFWEVWTCSVEKRGHNFCYLHFYSLWVHWLWQLPHHLVDLKGLSLFRSQAWWIKAFFPQKKMKDVICSLFTVKREWEKSLSYKNLMTSLGTFQEEEELLLFFFL